MNRRDVAIAALVGVLQVAGTALAASHQASRSKLDVVAYVLLAVGPAALVARRRLPVTVYGIVFASTLAYWAGGYRRGPIFLASLPSGRYTVEVKWDAWTFGKPVDLTEGRERVEFSWWRNVEDSRPIVRMAQNGEAPAQSIK